MIPKPIHYSDHARLRLRQRGITRQDVRWLLARGERVRIESKGPTQYWEVRGYLGKQEASVIFIEDAHSILVMTVQWME